MKVGLDVKDKRILGELDSDARQSNSRIAKKVGLSKDAVSYRIKNLEKQQIIAGYYSVLNIAKLGYLTYKFMLTFQNTNAEIEKEIIAYLKADKRVGWLVSCDGYYNLMAVAWVRSNAIFDDFFTEFLKKYSKYVKQRDVIVIIENHARRKAYLFNKKEDESPDNYYAGEPEFNLDETDVRIIKAMANNARVELHKIGTTTGLTGEAIAHRIKKLRQKNIVQAFRPIINTTQLGYGYYNVLFRLKRFDRIKNMFDFFKKHPNIIYFVRYLGSYDLGIDVEATDAGEVRKIITEIKELFSEDMESYLSISIYQQHKLSYLPE